MFIIIISTLIIRVLRFTKRTQKYHTDATMVVYIIVTGEERKVPRRNTVEAAGFTFNESPPKHCLKNNNINRRKKQCLKLSL